MTTYKPLDSDVTTYQPLDDDVTRYPALDDDITRYEPLDNNVQRPKTQTPGSAVRRPNDSGTRRPPTSSGTRSVASNNEGPLEVGQPFGTRYHITRVLGVGGMGAVYQAWDAELGG